MHFYTAKLISSKFYTYKAEPSVYHSARYARFAEMTEPSIIPKQFSVNSSFMVSDRYIVSKNKLKLGSNYLMKVFDIQESRYVERADFERLFTEK